MSLAVEVRAVVDDIRDALASSLDIHEAVERATPLLLRTVRADYAALGVTRPGAPSEFEWILAQMPKRFFDAYPEMAGNDFVLRAVLAAPNQVLRDAEMISRCDLETNLMYGRARDLGMPLEQVMSTMLHVDGEWSSGISLYRSERDPFSDDERAVLDAITPALKHAVRNCRLFAATERRARALDDLVSREGMAVVVFKPPAREVTRSEGLDALLSRWFSAEERGPAGLPVRIVDEVRCWSHKPTADVVPPSLTRERGDATLVVRPFWISERGARYVVVTFRETSQDPALPIEWQSRLTPRENEVVRRLLRGWDNRLIADELGCAEGTVKKHVSHVFDKLGADQRGQLIARSRRERR